jgi:hypothetical protein
MLLPHPEMYLLYNFHISLYNEIIAVVGDVMNVYSLHPVVCDEVLLCFINVQMLNKT